MYCPSCNTPNPAYEKYCSNCKTMLDGSGRKLADPVPKVAESISTEKDIHGYGAINNSRIYFVGGLTLMAFVLPLSFFDFRAIFIAGIIAIWSLVFFLIRKSRPVSNSHAPDTNIIDSNNPYAPPKSELSDTPTESRAYQISMVGSGRRFINYFIDQAICFILIMILAVLFVVVFREKAQETALGCILNLYAVLITIAYYFFMEARFGQTIGKMITKTIVVTETGDKPTLRQISVRSFSRYIPFEPFSCFGAQSRGWHDSIAKTYVVHKYIPD